MRSLVNRGAAQGTTDPREPLLCVEQYQGAPQSFMLHAAGTQLVGLVRHATLVPTTTRTVEQYRRVQVPGLVPDYAICANGGRLLVDGVVDEDWSLHVAPRLPACAPGAEGSAR